MTIGGGDVDRRLSILQLTSTTNFKCIEENMQVVLDMFMLFLEYAHENLLLSGPSTLLDFLGVAGRERREPLGNFEFIPYNGNL